MKHTGILILSIILCACSGPDVWDLRPGTNVYGTVTCGGSPVEGVTVCDGYAFVQTDSLGRYEMSSSKRSGSVYVRQPSGYAARCSGDSLVPCFFHSVSRDSTVVERCDFFLEKQDRDRYSVIFLPDAHLCNDEPVKHDLKSFDSIVMPVYRRIHERLSSEGAVLTVELGDLSHDRYWYSRHFTISDAYAHVLSAGIKAPLYGVTGNHDHDPAVICRDTPEGDYHAQKQFRSIFGPDRFSMDIGGDHWVFIDNIQYLNTSDPDSPYEGVAGSRDYEVGFTQDQMDWLRQDLMMIPDGTHVYMCAHAPLLSWTMAYHPESQISVLDSIVCLKHARMDFFAGHVHRMEHTVDVAHPSITVHSLSAVSGNMWEMFPSDHIVGLDGSEGAITFMSSCGGVMKLRSESYRGDNPYFRVYDMDSLRTVWTRDEDRKWIFDQVKDQVDFTDGAYRNMVLVNLWWNQPGTKLEIYEDGRALEVQKAPFTVDPEALYQSFNFRRGKYEGRKMNLREKELGYAGLYCAATSGQGVEVTVRALAPDGDVLAEHTLRR